MKLYQQQQPRKKSTIKSQQQQQQRTINVKRFRIAWKFRTQTMLISVDS